MQVKFIVNPVAGRGKGRRVWQAVEKMLAEEGYAYTAAFSTRPGEATILARRAVREGCQVVVALGGDGTVNEVANGIVGSGAALGIVPAGTGCDYIRSLPVPREPLEAARTIYTGRRLPVDAGLVNNRYFLGVTGIGIDAEVCRRVNEDLTWLGGKLAYIAGLLVTLVTYRPQRVRIVMDGETVEEEVMFVAVANARFFGGGMEIAPQADLQDGLLDVCVIKALPKNQLLRAFPRVFSGAHTDHPAFRAYRTRKVTITGPNPCSIQAEGEVIGRLPLEARILPGALSVMVQRFPGKDRAGG